MPVKGIVKRCDNLNCYEKGIRYQKASRLHRTYIKITKYGKTTWKPIGWYCPNCGQIILDNNEKYVPFNKYHKLEFDYNQLLKNLEKYSLEEK